MKRGKKTSIASDQLTEQEEPDDVTFDLIGTTSSKIIVRASSHLKMFESFLTEKETVIGQQTVFYLDF